MADLPVYVTLLPNGNSSANKLKFSIVLTPSLAKGASLPAPFAEWPKTSKALQTPLPGSLWSLKFNGNHPVSANHLLPVSAAPDSDLWKKLIGKLPVEERQFGKKY